MSRAGPPIEPPGQLLATNLSTVQPEAIDWIWPGRLARGKVTLLVGDPGTGKSFLTMEIIARISTGTGWPDGSPPHWGNAMLLNAEDGLADTVRPRLDAQAGDAIHVLAIQAVREGGRERSFTLERDVAALEKTLEGGHFSLLVVDPLSAYLGRSRDAHKDADVRSVLSPLVRLAERYRLAVLAVMHLNKDQQMKALYRATGSIAFTAMARMVFAVVPDGQDPATRLFIPVKSNLTEPVPGLAFVVDGGVLRWKQGAIDIDPEMALGGTAHSGIALQAVERAESFLREVLSAGPVHHEEVKRLAAQRCISQRTLARAKRRLGVQADRQGSFEDRAESFWQLPTPPTPTDTANLANSASTPTLPARDPS